MCVPLKVPFRTALRTVETMESVVVEVMTDTGHIGFGEAPATAVITGDTLPSITWAIEGVIGPVLLGREITELEEIMHLIQSAMVHNSSAKAALDMAIYDLSAQNLNIPLWKLLGGCRKELETDMTISENPVKQMIEDSLRAVEEGYGILKLKVGKNGIEDAEKVLQIRRELPEDIRLRIDANQGTEDCGADHTEAGGTGAGDGVRRAAGSSRRQRRIKIRNGSRDDTDPCRRSGIFCPGCCRTDTYAGSGSAQHQTDEDRRYLSGTDTL